MDHMRYNLARWLGVPLTAVLLALTVALPLMESRDWRGGPVLEAKHDPAHCIQGHDHRLCILGGVLRTLLPASRPRPLPETQVEGLREARWAEIPGRILHPLTRSRAPPFSL
jgi:hypothetical protein